MSDSSDSRVVVKYTITAAFDDQAVEGTFGPVYSQEAADAIVVSLASRTDVKKAVISKEAL